MDVNEYSLKELAAKFDLTIIGDSSLTIKGVCGISDNTANSLSFITDTTKIKNAKDSKISAFLCKTDLKLPGKTLLIHEAAEFVFCEISKLFETKKFNLERVQAHSVAIAESAKIHDSVRIGANVVIGDNVIIGQNTRIYPNCTIMDNTKIGCDCIIYSNCTIREHSILKDRVILQPGVCVGGDGFGYINHEKKHVKVPQLGNVILESDVEIGANSTIDRGRFSSTTIGSGTKIDNLVMVGHNVKVGKDCLLVSQVGVSGSTELGDRVTLAGQVGTIGHVHIADDVTVLGKGGITKSILKAGVYAGMPARPAKEWKRAIAKLYGLVKNSSKKVKDKK